MPSTADPLIVRTQGNRLDQSYLQGEAARLNVVDLLERALANPTS